MSKTSKKQKNIRMTMVPEMPHIYYVINFRNGMAYVHNFQRIKEIVTAECDVSIGKALSQHEYMNMIDRYIDHHYVPGPIEVFPVFDYNADIWWKDNLHQAAPERSSRLFLVFSPLPARVGYFTSVDKMLTAFHEEPPGTFVHEVSDYDQAVSIAQKLFAKQVLCFSGYFDKNAEKLPVLAKLPTDSLITLPYREWMQSHCVLPPILQEYSIYGFVKPESAPDQYSPLFNKG